ncbi:TPA: hypothetical protein ACPVZG_000448 [Vibrio parahaemolyticus]
MFTLNNPDSKDGNPIEIKIGERLSMELKLDDKSKVSLEVKTVVKPTFYATITFFAFDEKTHTELAKVEVTRSIHQMCQIETDCKSYELSHSANELKEAIEFLKFKGEVADKLLRYIHENLNDILEVLFNLNLIQQFKDGSKEKLLSAVKDTVIKKKSFTPLSEEMRDYFTEKMLSHDYIDHPDGEFRFDIILCDDDSGLPLDIFTLVKLDNTYFKSIDDKNTSRHVTAISEDEAVHYLATTYIES